MSTTQPQSLLEYITQSVRGWIEEWVSFWFTPADPLMLGLIRVLTGWMLTYNLLVWGLDLPAFFAADGLQPLSAITSLHRNDYVFSFLFWVPDTWLITVHWVCVAVAALFCVGALTRVTSVLAFLITISYSQRVPVANFGFDQLLGMLCLYLAIGPSGAALSVDSWIRRYRARRNGRDWRVPQLPSACMTLRLIQVHLCVIYFWAGFAKLKGDSWWTGEAMWQVIANQEYQTMDLTWMAWVPWVPYLIAHVTVAWEVGFCALVWNHRLRPLMLALGTAMHFGIGAFLGMWTFGLIMTFPYFAFSDGALWRRRLSRIVSARANNKEMLKSAMVCEEMGSPYWNETTFASEADAAEIQDRSVEEDDQIMRGEPAPHHSPPAAGELSAPSAAARSGSGNVSSEQLDTNCESPDVAHEAIASKQLAGSTFDTANALTSVPPVQFDDRIEDSVLAPETEVLLIAVHAAERNTFRTYLRRHDIPCRAAVSAQNAVSVVLEMRPAAILISGSMMNLQEIVTLVNDLNDMIDAPILALLTASQIKLCGSDPLPIHVLQYPASLRQIRAELTGILLEDDSAKARCSLRTATTPDRTA